MDSIAHSTIPIEDYHADRSAVSSSELKRILVSPAHYQRYLISPPLPTSAQEFGSAVHAALFEPRRFALEYAVQPKLNSRTKEGKSATEAFRREHLGQRFLSQADWEAIQTIRAKVLERQFANLLLSEPNGVPEQALYWVDHSAGVGEGIRCKCRPDWRCEVAILDLKTTTDASALAFARDIVKYGYDLSAAFYVDGVSQTSSGALLPFVFVVVEKETSEVALYQADAEMIEVGREKYRRALSMLAECRKTGTWPGYQPSGDIEDISLPRWAV
jgi:exodeoxyribonuclease VIII